MNELKKLWPFMKTYKLSFVVVIICGFIMSATSVGLPAAVKYIFGEAIPKKDLNLLVLYSLAIPGLYLIHGISRFIHLYLLYYTSDWILSDIRAALQKKFMRLNLTFYGNYSSGTGGMLSRILNDLQLVYTGMGILADCVREPLTVIGIVAYMLYLDWKLTIFALIVVPIVLGGLKQIGKSVRKYSHKVQENMERLTSTLKETLDGVRIIQSFGLENEMERRLQEVHADYLSIRKKMVARQEIAGPVTEFVAACIVAGVVIYFGSLVIGNEAEMGVFFAFMAAIGTLSPSIKKLQDGYVRLQPTFATINRVYDVLDSLEEVPQKQSQHLFPDNFKTIRFENVTFKYDDKVVLNSVNLTVKRGEVIALVGMSGSGKSTLVNLLARFYEPSKGRIFIDDIPLEEIRLSELRKNIALVTQEVFLFNDTIERNIQAGDFNRKDGSVEDASEAANAKEFILQTPYGFKTMVGDRGGRLSGGEKQRISIARAIYKDSPILILDEATSALDSASEVEVQKGLDRLMQGRTVFVIAHRLSTVTKADRILVLSAGNIIEEGKHEELIDRKGAYFNFVKLQSF